MTFDEASSSYQQADLVLYCIGLDWIGLDCIVLYCIVLYCTVLYCTVLYCIVDSDWRVVKDSATCYLHAICLDLLTIIDLILQTGTENGEQKKKR